MATANSYTRVESMPAFMGLYRRVACMRLGDKLRPIGEFIFAFAFSFDVSTSVCRSMPLAVRRHLDRGSKLSTHSQQITNTAYNEAYTNCLHVNQYSHIYCGVFSGVAIVRPPRPLWPDHEFFGDLI
jgi:hypothetical protein